MARLQSKEIVDFFLVLPLRCCLAAPGACRGAFALASALSQ
jgi:hypothetical protein